MKKYIFKYILIFSCLASLFSFSQEGKLNRAKKNYDKLSFIKASEVYLNVAESGYKSKELFEKLGNTYYFNADYVNAAKWYGELFSFTKNNVESIYLLRYAQSLKSNNKPDLAKQYYDSFLSTLPSTNSQALTTQDYLDLIEKNSSRYTINTTAINTDGVDFGTSKINEKQLVFASTRDTGVVFKRRHTWNNLPFMDLYLATINEDGNLSGAEKLKGDVNTKHHETTATFTKDGKTMYFTRNNTTPDSKQTVQRLKIYKATLINDKWKNVEEVALINSDDYSTAHPSLNATDTKLYFVSDKAGGNGLTDIYVSNIDSNGKISLPKNAGDLINTRGRESFPYITTNNELYFSSDGHFGLGGYDVFYADLNDAEPELLNVGKPINSEFDDVVFIINHKTKKGYISSNRDGGLGNDDIYSFIETKEIQKTECDIFGTVTDAKTKEPIPFATITVLDLDNTPVETLQTDGTGNYKVTLKCNKSYLIRAEKDTYDTKEYVVETKAEENKRDFELVKDEVEIVDGLDVGLVIIDKIYFDLDKWNIRPDAAVELQKIISILKSNPNIKIDVRSHTDSRANDAYNMRLSDRRAKSTIQYIIDNGIDASRLTGRGYGESQLVNRCTNGVKCSKAEHQQNRRSEFIVVSE